MTETPSLHRRVTLAVLALLALVLLILGVAIDLTFGAQVRHDLHDRLIATATRADALAQAGTAPGELAAELNGGSIRALLVTADGATFGDPAISPDIASAPSARMPPPPPPPRPGPAGGPGAPGPPPSPPPRPDETNTVVVHPLPAGGRVILVADTTQSTAAVRDLRELMIGAGAVTLVLAALLLFAVARGALRPLERLTGLAQAITTGDRGRRLEPDRPHTELGRAAAAFDGMLDALETAERQAQQAAEAAQRAEARTRDFLADAAHELRTPLAGIQVAAEQLVNTTSDAAPAARRRTQLLLADARRASRLVTDMLDLSRIDAGLPLRVIDTDLAGIADAQVERADMLAPQVSATRTGAAHLPMRADPHRVGQIVANLLDNARRYTPPGGRITVHVDRSDTGAALLTVTDTGPGIPQADRTRVFDRLVRLDTSRNRDHGGAGLGLSIARALARAHGGELTCEPWESGAQFRLSLPVTDVSQ
ncbi:HAMP domain-containing sensor histidine kinase [Mycolicibacterium sp.]|uniref:HAMP domain-containing sensor histidine kinase n=1 Tax=Mycolicibacterium sp. TaxID=2320850 RepID=UPI001A1E01EB|nr:HAMP domain-containing sensor histidine kinase [Mycolicibacterium sp.]MBJ7338831.1 HAMP domain-containing histidine kinase [Mycolicibacterium sp.]